jgi:ABC-type transporter Mla subunit MlaD
VKTAAVEVLCDDPNYWVVRTPGRNHPALVVQGDTFHGILADVESLASALKVTLGENSELAHEAAAIVELLRERLDRYSHALLQHSLSLPYPVDDHGG